MENENATFEAGRIVRDGVLDAANKAAMQIATLMAGADVNAIEAIIATEISAAFNDAADRLSVRNQVYRTEPLAGTKT